jgi:hypothetical protein
MALPPKARASHKEQGQLRMKCNRIYKTRETINILLRPAEAVTALSNMMKKVNLLVENGLADEWTIKLWSTGGNSLQFGLEKAVKGEQKKRPK